MKSEGFYHFTTFLTKDPYAQYAYFRLLKKSVNSISAQHRCYVFLGEVSKVVKYSAGQKFRTFNAMNFL